MCLGAVNASSVDARRNAMALTRIQWISLLGLVVSAYAVYVEHAKQADPSYVAACDLSGWGGIFKNISCSKVRARACALRRLLRCSYLWRAT